VIARRVRHSDGGDVPVDLLVVRILP